MPHLRFVRWPVVAVLLLQAGCAYHDQTDQLVTRGFMREQFPEVRAPDLQAGTACPTTFGVTVQIIDPQQGARYLARAPGPIYVDGPRFEGMVKRYFEDVLREAKLRVQPAGGTIIGVRVDDASVSTGWGPSAMRLALRVTIPERGYSAVHVGQETSGTIPRSIAYGVHEAVFSFVRNASVQRLLRCQ